MNFKIPQNLEIKDKIVGPLTMQGLIIAGVGGAIAYWAYMKLDDDTWPWIAIPVVLITLAVIFVKINDMPFLKWLYHLLLFLVFIPQKRVWAKLSDSPEILMDFNTIQVKKEIDKKTNIENLKEEKRKKLENLAKQLKNEG